MIKKLINPKHYNKFFSSVNVNLTNPNNPIKYQVSNKFSEWLLNNNIDVYIVTDFFVYDTIDNDYDLLSNEDFGAFHVSIVFYFPSEETLAFFILEWE